MSLSDPLKVVKKVTDVFAELEIRYLVGGSLASSLYGIPRATPAGEACSTVEQ
jgi:hypothetical protein